ncbi:MAG: hypothetical protein JSU06_19960 [Actinobacteria bacterium]|nr:hypothetical protein [Actinomycetota bacterium]
MATVTVPRRFNGPPASGQGGYSCALLAAHLEGPAAVSLRRPIPLGKPLAVRFADGAARAHSPSDELIAEAVPAPPLAPWDAPAVDLDTARAATARFTTPPDGTFDHCFVCGRARADGFHVCAGPVAGTELVASPWTPPTWAADAGGGVLPEFVWAALDCPGYFALHGTDLPVAFLARQQTAIVAPPRAGVEHIVVGRPLARDGRKGFAATAILDPDGTVLAHSELLVIVPRGASVP